MEESAEDGCWLITLGYDAKRKLSAHQKVFQSEDYLNDWEGTTVKSNSSNKELLPTGTYYYILKLGGTNRSLKGFIYISY